MFAVGLYEDELPADEHPLAEGAGVGMAQGAFVGIGRIGVGTRGAVHGLLRALRADHRC
jgi:hypothetical protein